MGAFLWALVLLGHPLHLLHFEAFFPASPKIQPDLQILSPKALGEAQRKDQSDPIPALGVWWREIKQGARKSGAACWREGGICPWRLGAVAGGGMERVVLR